MHSYVRLGIARQLLCSRSPVRRGCSERVEQMAASSFQLSSICNFLLFFFFFAFRNFLHSMSNGFNLLLLPLSAAANFIAGAARGYSSKITRNERVYYSFNDVVSSSLIRTRMRAKCRARNASIAGDDGLAFECCDSLRFIWARNRESDPEFIASAI